MTELDLEAYPEIAAVIARAERRAPSKSQLRQSRRLATEIRQLVAATRAAVEEEWRARVANVTVLVAGQAEDDGLWFEAQTAAEAYLQQELRRLHEAVEHAALRAVAEGEEK